MENINEEQEIVNVTPQPKTPFIGLLIAIVGIILLISSFFGNKTEMIKVNANITYASTLKASKIKPVNKVQEIKVSYEFNNRKYETKIDEIINGNFKKYDNVEIFVDEKKPTNISLKKNTNSKLLSSIVIIFIGISTFLGLFDPVIAFIKTFINPKYTDEENEINDENPDKKLSFVDIAIDAASGIPNTINRIFKK